MDSWVLPAILLVAVIAASGCTVSTTSLPVGDAVKADVANYSSAIMDSMMAGLNSGDYGAFSADFSDNMLQVMDSEKFGQTESLLRSTVGRYVSRESNPNVDEYQGYYRAVFTAHFTSDDPVAVTMTFRKDGAEHRVEGVWFSSKKLAGSF